jgi:Dihydroorotase
MPNTVPPIASAADIATYRSEIEAAAPGLEPLMTFKLLPGMDADTVGDCAAAGAIAAKYYPAGSTTNASDGLADPEQAADALAAMEEAGLVLCVHAEEPEAKVLEREAAFIPTLEAILSAHPRLRLVVEHISTEAMLRFVLAGPLRLAGTVTAHHLLFSLEDMLGEAMIPALYCKPVLKSTRDRDALRDAVFRGEPKLFFGSDSAPHPVAAKLSARAASGVYSSPSAVAALATIFEAASALPELEPFLSRRGAAFYGLQPSRGALELERAEWEIPAELDGCLPMPSPGGLGWMTRRVRIS